MTKGGLAWLPNGIQPGFLRPPITSSRGPQFSAAPWQPSLMRVSQNVINTAKPPQVSCLSLPLPNFLLSSQSIPLIRAWGSRYHPTPTHPLIDMSQGVPGIPPPKALLDAIAVYGSSESASSYADISGETCMRSSLADEMRAVYGDHVDVNPDDIVLTAGCNMAFVAAIIALADPGDQVILPVPW